MGGSLQVGRDRELPCAQLIAPFRGTDEGQEAAAVHLERNGIGWMNNWHGISLVDRLLDYIVR